MLGWLHNGAYIHMKSSIRAFLGFIFLVVLMRTFFSCTIVSRKKFLLQQGIILANFRKDCISDTLLGNQPLTQEHAYELESWPEPGMVLAYAYQNDSRVCTVG